MEDLSKPRSKITKFFKHSPNNSQLVYNPFNQVCKKFFDTFLQQNRIIVCKIQQCFVVNKTPYCNQFALYQIEVLTQDKHFYCRKRYTQFANLYKKLRKIINIIIDFPKKTYIRSGSCTLVTNLRINKLNDFIQFILKVKEPIFVRYSFLDFISLWTQYGGNDTFTAIPKFTYSQEILEVQMIKLNQKGDNLSNTLKRIHTILIDSHKKMKKDVLKDLIIGFEGKKGLFDIILEFKNQQLAIQGMKLLVDLIDPQYKSDSDIVLTIIQSQSEQKMIPRNQNHLQNLQYRLLYFQLLKKYWSKKYQPQLDLIFANRQNFRQQYEIWAKNTFKVPQFSQSKKTQNNQIYYQCKNSNKLQNIFSSIDQQHISVFTYQNQSQSIIAQTYYLKSKPILKVTIHSKVNFDELKMLILQMKWNSMFILKSIDPYSQMITRKATNMEDLQINMIPKVVQQNANSFIMTVKPLYVAFHHNSFSQLYRLRVQSGITIIQIWFEFQCESTMISFKQQLSVDGLLQTSIINQMIIKQL